MIGKWVLDDFCNVFMFYFLWIVLELKFKYFVIENVKGLIIGKYRFVFEEVIDKFFKNGY